MKAVLIQGSPKNQGSTSEMIVAALQSRLTKAAGSAQAAAPTQNVAPAQAAAPTQNAAPAQATTPVQAIASTPAIDCVICHAAKQSRDEIVAALAGCDALILVFPLYVDGIPSHLLRLLDETRDAIANSAPNATVYCVANNGFFEARQNRIALEMVQNFCVRSNLKWGQGLGVGGGGMVGAAPIGQGPMKPLGKALDALVENILGSKTADNRFVEPNFPKSLYQMGAHLNWRLEAKKHGLKAKQLYDRPQT